MSKPRSWLSNTLWSMVWATAFLLFVLSRTLFFKQGVLENSSSMVLYPFLRLGKSISSPIHRFILSQQEKQALLHKIETLEATLGLLQEEKIKQEATAHKEEKIADLINFQKRYEIESFMVSKVLAKHFDHNEQYFILDRGSAHGVEKNTCATYKFQLIGKITEVFPYHSKLTLISDQRSKIAAFTNSTKTQGIVVGKNDANHLCKLEYVSHLAPVQKGDYVISSGQGMVVPEGFCLGEVLEQKTNGVCHLIDIKPLIDLSGIEYCTLLDKKESISF